MLLKIIKVFPYKRSGNNFVGFKRNLEADKNKRKNERLWSFYFLQPKIQLFAKLKQKKLNLFQISVIQNGEKAKRLFKRKRA